MVTFFDMSLFLYTLNSPQNSQHLAHFLAHSESLNQYFGINQSLAILTLSRWSLKGPQ